MITQEDIEALEEQYKDAFEAGEEFTHRCSKGIPTDRWVTGQQGYKLIADCLRGYQKIIGIQNIAINELYADILRRSEDSMEPTPDPMRPENANSPTRSKDSPTSME